MVLALAIALFSVAFIYIDYRVNHCFLTPLEMFVGLWCLIAVLSSLQLFGFTGFSEFSLVIILIGIIFFFIGTLLSSFIFSRREALLIKNDDSVSPDARFLYLLLVISLLINILLFFVAARAVISGASYESVRGDLLGYSTGGGNVSPLLIKLSNYVAGPIGYFLPAVALVFLAERKHFRFVVLAFLNFALGVVASGGRIGIVYLAVEMAIVAVFYGESLTTRMKKLIVLVLGLGVAAVVGLTIIRSSSGFAVSAYKYFTVPVALLDHFCAQVSAENFYSYGAAFLYPITYLINVACKLFSFDSSFFADVVNYVSLPQKVWVSGIYPNSSSNAFSTLFYYFYLDGRFIGVALGSLIFGFLSNCSFKKATYERSTQAFLWYLMFSQAIVGSFIIWRLGSTKFVLACFLLWLALHSPVRRLLVYVRERRNQPKKA